METQPLYFLLHLFLIIEVVCYTFAEFIPVLSEVLSFCTISVWSPPPQPFLYSGYDVRYFIPHGGQVIIRKSEVEFFHLVTMEERSLGPEEQILVQVLH